MSDLYDRDILEWSEHQAALLKRRAAGELVNDAAFDWPSIAEEIESLGVSQRTELRNRLRVVLEHLFKLQFSMAADPRNGWIDTVIEQRRQIETLLDASPSLKNAVPGYVAVYMDKARATAAEALARYGDPGAVDPVADFTVDQVLGNWLP
jgi:hypothetical protein